MLQTKNANNIDTTFIAIYKSEAILLIPNIWLIPTPSFKNNIQDTHLTKIGKNIKIPATIPNVPTVDFRSLTQL